MSNAKLGDYITKYLEVRDLKKALEDRHKEELRPINEVLGKLEVFFQTTMAKLGVENLKGTTGTAYTSTTASVTTADKMAFLDFVKEHDAWHLLDVRPAKTATKEYLEEHGMAPPGVNVVQVINVNVRKS